MATALEHLKWASVTAVLFLSSLLVNELIFVHSEYIRGANWIYLPAGIRLLSTLLFGYAGATGLLIASWIACFFYFFPDDFMRSAMGGIIATVAPLAAYFLANGILKMGRNLRNLTPFGLLLCVLLYAFLNSILHYAWAVMSGARSHSFELLVAMFVGDSLGALIICYFIKLLLFGIQMKGSRSLQSK